MPRAFNGSARQKQCVSWRAVMHSKKHMGRQTCGENMVFCRGLTGQVATLEDFCPIAARRLLEALWKMENGAAATTAWRWAATAPPCGCRPASTEGACNKTVDPAPGMGRKRTGAYGGVRSRKILERLSARRTRGQISSCIIAPAPASAGLAGRSPAPRIQPSAHGALLKRTVHAHLVGRSAAQ